MPHPAERPDTQDLLRGHTTVGDFDLTICTDGTYFLDGGAMFGVVPKPLWEKHAPADSENRIMLGANTVIVRTGKHTVAIETGLGNKLPAKLREIYGASERLPKSLCGGRVRPEEVDIVINTHLHFDHCGWNTRRNEAGQIVPTFPNARYFAHRGEVEHGHKQLERDRISYISDNYDPLVASGQMTLLEGNRRGYRSRHFLRSFPRAHRPVDGRSHRFRRPARLLYLRPDSDQRASGSHLGHGLRLFPLTSIEQRKRFYRTPSRRNGWCCLPTTTITQWEELYWVKRAGQNYVRWNSGILE